MMPKNTGIEGAGSEGSFNLGKDDLTMSISHLKDRLEYNLRHAEEHMVKAKEACERLSKAGVTPAIPRSLVDLGEYFEQKGGYEESVDSKVREAAKKTYK